MRNRRLLAIGGGVAVSAFVAGGASPQLDKAVQKCIEGFSANKFVCQ